ncbi:hypothetical protein CGH49_24155, partial [Vibrio parahaemolyticus]
ILTSLGNLISIKLLKTWLDNKNENLYLSNGSASIISDTKEQATCKPPPKCKLDAFITICFIT